MTSYRHGIDALTFSQVPGSDLAAVLQGVEIMVRSLSNLEQKLNHVGCRYA